MITPAHLAYMSFLVASEVSRQKQIVKARKYYEGIHNTHITKRLKEFLSVNEDDGDPFRLNVYRTVVRAVEERLSVKATNASSGDESALAEAESQAAWSWQVWQGNRMDGLQSQVYEGSLTDGEFFIIVDWDIEQGRPRFNLHPRYTDAMQGGDGFGCKAHYPDDDDNQPMLYASKRWVESLGRGKTRQRLTLYYPDEVQRYVIEGGAPVSFEEDGVLAVQPWVDNAGVPLGIPVIHFRNPGQRPEAEDAIGPQDAINKSLIDLIAAADISGFPIYKAFGWIPTSDGKPLESDGTNRMNLQPGQIIGTTKTEASFDAVEAADLSTLIDLPDKIIQWLAMVTDTPMSRFLSSRQIAAEGTLKQQEAPLISKIEKRQTSFGNSWEDCFYMARRIANTFGNAGMSDDVLFSVSWEQAETRNEKEHLEGLAIKREKLGVPLSQIWSEAGYSQSEINDMLANDETQARLAMMQLGLAGLQSGEDEEG